MLVIPFLKSPKSFDLLQFLTDKRMTHLNSHSFTISLNRLRESLMQRTSIKFYAPKLPAKVKIPTLLRRTTCSSLANQKKIMPLKARHLFCAIHQRTRSPDNTPSTAVAFYKILAIFTLACDCHRR